MTSFLEVGDSSIIVSKFLQFKIFVWANISFVRTFHLCEQTDKRTDKQTNRQTNQQTTKIYLVL